MSSARTTRLAALGAATIGALFAAGIGSELFPTLKDQLETSSFLPAQGQIASCEVRGTPPRVPEIQVSYRYVYGQREYEGNRWRAIPWMLDRAGGGRDRAAAVVAPSANFTKQRLTELVPGKRVVWLVVDSDLGFVEDTHEWTGTRVILDLARKAT